jgi:hypothetical protein
MKNLTKRELEDYDNCRIRPPAEYQAMKTDERRAFVCEELATGNYALEESLSIHDLLFFNNQSGFESPEFFLYKILLERKDPAQVERHLTEDMGYMLFFEIYGLESAKTHLKSARLLDLHALLYFTGDDIHVSTDDVEIILKERGCEAVAAVVTNDIMCESLVEIFGLKAVQFVRKSVANKFKGDRLEEALGL